MRAGHTKDHMAELTRKATVFFVYTNYPHVAATKVRSGSGGMISSDVQAYISKHRLYQS
jgi:hypothetical protein